MAASENRIAEERMLPELAATARLFAVHWRKVREGWNYPAHRHAQLEMNWVLEGSQRMIVEGEELELTAGQYLCIRSGALHRSEAIGSTDMAYFCLHVETDDAALLSAMRRKPWRLMLIDQPASEAESRCAEALKRLLERTKALGGGTTAERMYVMADAYVLLGALAELVRSDEVVEEGRLSQPAQRRIAERLAVMLDEAAASNYGQAGADLPDRLLLSLAERLGYTPSYCNKLFRRLYGLSPRQYLSARLLSRAKLLLLDPELKIEEVARRLGYPEQAHFSRQFKRWTGLTPSAYRRLQWKDEAPE